MNVTVKVNFLDILRFLSLFFFNKLLLLSKLLLLFSSEVTKGVAIRRTRFKMKSFINSLFSIYLIKFSICVSFIFWLFIFILLFSIFILFRPGILFKKNKILHWTYKVYARSKSRYVSSIQVCLNKMTDSEWIPRKWFVRRIQICGFWFLVTWD